MVLDTEHGVDYLLEFSQRRTLQNGQRVLVYGLQTRSEQLATCPQYVLI